jgi:hypothetical protein
MVVRSAATLYVVPAPHMKSSPENETIYSRKVSQPDGTLSLGAKTKRNTGLPSVISVFMGGSLHSIRNRSEKWVGGVRVDYFSIAIVWHSFLLCCSMNNDDTTASPNPMLNASQRDRRDFQFYRVS